MTPRLFLVVAVLALSVFGPAAAEAVVVCVEDGGTALCSDAQASPKRFWHQASSISGCNAAELSTTGFGSEAADKSDVVRQAKCEFDACNAAGGTESAWYDVTTSLGYEISGSKDYWPVVVYPVPNCPSSGNYIQRLYFTRDVACPNGYQSQSTYPYCYKPVEDCPPLCSYDARAAPAAVGNPITVGTGAKLETATDYRGDGAFPLEFSRHYHSQGNHIVPGSGFSPQAIGLYWRHTYERYVIARTTASGTTAFVLRPEGGVVWYRQTGSSWTGRADDRNVLSRLADANGQAVGWRYVTIADDVELYDVNGRLASITNRAGLAQTLSYDGQGRLVAVADSFGRQLTFTYDASNRIATMVDPGGGQYDYSYDPLFYVNRLVSVRFPDLETRTYLYNEPQYTGSADLPYALTGILDEEGQRFATFQYLWNGRAYKSAHAGGAEQVELSGVAPSVTVTDARGTQRSYSFVNSANVHRISTISQPCAPPGCSGNGTATYTFNANGFTSSKIDFAGRKVCYAYDPMRNLETARVEGLLVSEDCAAALAAPPSRPDVRRVVTSWHPTYRLPATIGEPAAGGTRTTTFTYDASGNLLQKVITAPKNDGSGGTTSRSWAWTYTTLGRVRTATDPNGNPTTYSYYPDNDADLDRRGNVATLTNALGHVTQFTAYDAHGRPLAVVDPNGLTTTLTYDARGRLVARNVGGEITAYTYDGVGQMTRVTRPDGSYLTHGYDGAHRLTHVADGLGNRIVYTLDGLGNRLLEQTYDAANVVSRSRSRTIDPLGRVASEIGALGQTTAYTYDGNGNLATTTDPLLHTTTHSYDALNRLTQVLDAAAATTGYGYDPAGNLIQVTDPGGLATGYTMDGLGNVLLQASPDTGVTTATFDAAGSVLSRQNAKGVTATYSYDALQRVTQIVYSKPGLSSLTHGFEYDGGQTGAPNAKGRLTKVTDATGTTTFAYDGHGRITGKTQTVGALTQSVQYAYDSGGRLAQLTTPSGQAIGYTYVNNRISGITFNGTPLLANAYTTPFGPVGAWQWGNGTQSFRIHDSDGRLASWELTAGGVSLVENALSYDAAGRVTAITDPIRPTLSQSYPSYDAVDRLLRAETGSPAAHVRQFTYDANGNRQTSTLDGATTTYAYTGGTNQLATLAGATSRSFVYNAVGNANVWGPFTFTYDRAERLNQVSVGGATVASYSVNALGQRVKKTVGATITHFVYDEQGRLLGEYDGAGTIIQETVWLDELPVAILRPFVGVTPLTLNTFYVHADHLGSPRAITRLSDNALRWTWDNVDPFGANAENPSPAGSPTFNYPLRFPGQYFDAETGMHYNYFRDYDPAIGRYVESDPIGLKGGINTYAYVSANPLVRVDPEGLAQVCYGMPNTFPHYWLCANGNCGGLVPQDGEGMFGGKGFVRPEKPGTGSCTPVNDNNCDKDKLDKCISDSINEQRGNRIYHLMSNNCVDWAWQTIQRCRKQSCK